MSVSTPNSRVIVPGAHLLAALLGERDELLRHVEQAFAQTKILVRGNEITAAGPESDLVGRLFLELSELLQRGESLDLIILGRVIDMVRNDVSPSSVLTADIVRVGQSRPVRAKTAGQRRYVDAIAEHVITFALGPAGTGKSWLAVAMAVQALHSKSVQRIILTRPAVEAGERLGFLPGDLMAKIDPYLRPLFDALHDMVGADNAQKYLERGVVEVAPLAFMRGRTLNNSFIILDEAQNTTPEQMKMFLTRIGFGSKIVVTGDTTQVDVPDGRSGLAGLERVLTGIDGLTFVHLEYTDVVRHKIVADIVAAYETNSDKSAARLRGVKRRD
jgi:phosphate starvation-inducible PhoH-like protein